MANKSEKNPSEIIRGFIDSRKSSQKEYLDGERHYNRMVGDGEC